MQRDELSVEIVDAKVAARGFGRAFHDHSAGRVEALDLDVVVAPSRTARISDRQPRGLERHLGLRRMDVAGENCPVGAVLHFDAIGSDIDGRVAVVALERRDGLFLPHLRERRRAARGARARMMPKMRTPLI